MNQLQSIYKLLPSTLILLIIAAGCSVNDSNNAGPKPVAVTMQISGSASPKASQHRVSSNHVTLTSVKMLVEELELESVEDDSTDFEMENQVVELPLDGSPYELSAQDISSGLYDEFELEVEGYDEDDNASDPDFTEGSDETSIVIKGTHNGQDFTFKSETDFELEFEFNPPIEISENTNSVDINLMVNIDTWFVDPDNGDELDPQNPGDREQIEENIENSFEANEMVDEEDDGDDNDDGSD